MLVTLTAVVTVSVSFGLPQSNGGLSWTHGFHAMDFIPWISYHGFHNNFEGSECRQSLNIKHMTLSHLRLPLLEAGKMNDMIWYECSPDEVRRHSSPSQTKFCFFLRKMALVALLSSVPPETEGETGRVDLNCLSVSARLTDSKSKTTRMKSRIFSSNT